MPSNTQIYIQLADETARQITGSHKDWTAFLTTAARLYKYPYHEQLMIYAQRPDAIACADYDLWNKTMRRYVRRGSKGIALIDDSGEVPKLRYVFDISDTGGRDNSRRPFLWEYRPEHNHSVSFALERNFLVGGNAGLDRQLEEIAQKLTDEYWDEHKRDLLDIVDDSFLEDYDEFNIGVQFRNAATVSTTYSLMSRCGLEPDEYFEHEDFLSIFDFNTPATMTFLGTAVSDANQQVLRQIEIAIKNYERSKAHEQHSDLHEERGLSDTRPDNSADRGSALGQIREDAEIVPERASGSDVQSSASQREADGTPERDRADSEPPLGADDATNDGGTGLDGGFESQRPDEVGGPDEQPESAGRGNDSDGAGFQITLFPTEVGQINLIEEAESISPSASSVSQADIDAELLRGTGTQGGKLRVYTVFQNTTEQKDRITFLRGEYNSYGHSHTYLDGSGGFINYTPKGMELSGRGFEDKVEISYSKMANRLAELIANDNYLTADEKTPLAPPAPEPLTESAPRSVTQADIDAAIQSWNGDIKSKHTIERHMKKHARDRETAAFLRNEYGGDLAALSVTVDGVTHDVPWAKVQRRIVQLMEADRFYTEHEQDNFDDIDPIAIGEALAERGIVDGEIVDRDLFESSPFIQQVTADAERIAAEEQTEQPISPPPIFFVDWEQAQYDLDLSNYADRDIIGYNKDGVQYALGRSGGITYTTQTSMITSWGEVLGNEHIPADIRQQVYDYNNGNLTEEQVRANYLAILGIALPQSEIPAENFRITDDNLGAGGPKAKYAMNVEAIRTLQQIEAEGRSATVEEQEILSRYVGWGGLPDAFDPEKPAWASEYKELSALLAPGEYESARESTLNAHYTSPTVIKAIYRAVESMGFRTGNILEPACGVGNFFGLLPESMAKSRLYGTELDSITGRIAGQLYPNADIQVAGFETTDRRDFYDLAIGNVPFGQYKVADKPYDKLGFSIHDYFFAKALDQVRPGGVIAFVTSRYTMDKKSPEVRRYIAERAELLGAIRLPNNAFKANAGTEVVSDIIFLQKRDRPIISDPAWVHLGQTDAGHAINSYFVEHPEMVLGTLTSENTQYGREECTVIPIEGADLADQLREAVSNIHGEITETELPDLGEGELIDTSIPADPNVKNYSYTVVDGEVYYRENSVMVRPELNATAMERVKGMVELRDCVQSLIDQQLDGYTSDAEISATQAELNRLYDDFTAKYGLINSRGNSLAFADDSSYYLLCSLEVLDENRELERKADMFAKRTIRQSQVVTSVDTASEALAVSISEKACVDLDYMSELSGLSREKLLEDLRGVVFLNVGSAESPSEAYVTADDYLSGNIREKLQLAKAAADTLPSLSVNVQALEAALPKDLDASEIDVRLGATWIHKDYIREFMYETFQTPGYQQGVIDVSYTAFTAEWNIKGKSAASWNDVAARTTYGTERANAYRILEDTLNLRDIRIYDTIEDADGKERRVLNKKETTLAQHVYYNIKM